MKLLVYFYIEKTRTGFDKLTVLPVFMFLENIMMGSFNPLFKCDFAKKGESLLHCLQWFSACCWIISSSGFFILSMWRKDQHMGSNTSLLSLILFTLLKGYSRVEWVSRYWLWCYVKNGRIKFQTPEKKILQVWNK